MLLISFTVLVLSPAVCLIYQGALTCASSSLPPLLSLADISKKIAPVSWEVKDTKSEVLVCLVQWR